jgi:hypothetical protein
MTKKKKTASAAENLIESLMDDLKDIPMETSISRQFNDKESGAPLIDEPNLIDFSRLNLDPLNGSFDAANLQLEKSGKSSEPESILNSTKFDGKELDEKTLAIPLDLDSDLIFERPQAPSISKVDADRTLAVTGFANAKPAAVRASQPDVKVSVGNFRGGKGIANVMTSVDASLAQSENLKMAQHRISELEQEIEQLRIENEELSSAGEIVRSRLDALNSRILNLEKEKVEVQESARSEILLLKGGVQFKENEVNKARLRIEELESRLKSDFKKIRVRERELENRLELLRAEKSALVRAKDDYILDQKRKIDQLSQELDNYRNKCLELNKVIETNQDQVKRTERALRLALTNLESKEDSSVPMKKAD